MNRLRLNTRHELSLLEDHPPLICRDDCVVLVVVLPEVLLVDHVFQVYEVFEVSRAVGSDAVVNEIGYKSDVFVDEIRYLIWKG